MLKLSFYMVACVLLSPYSVFGQVFISGPCPRPQSLVHNIPAFSAEVYYKGLFSEAPLTLEPVNYPCEPAGLFLHSSSDNVIGTDNRSYFLIFMCVYDQQFNHHLAHAMLYTVDMISSPVVHEAVKNDLYRNNLNLNYYYPMCV
ncbi:uncharacterized protein LOC115632987 [Scaptodrosophila lebanonensis]|uniref:Uncharacterized protein LOC115632987 n=1 Tax=Drosophila lebanonensis TaxID=7225 RepID=A0A6J2UCR4_DROLE|nr:uncharacterized protein LOC115632987 [Scaptodrosophila lebanonensis]